MKKLIYLLVFGAFIACDNKKPTATATEQDTSLNNEVVTKNTTPIAPPTTILQIKSAYGATQLALQQKTLDSIVLRYNCQNERSGTISYYQKDDKVNVIKHSYNEYDHFEATDWYYLQNNELNFVYLRRLNWSFEADSSGQPSTKDDITESRFYFIKEKPSLYLEKKYTVHSTAKNTFDAERIANRTIKPKDITSLLAQFEKLKAYKNRPQGGCFER